jgi:hypothetical protein
MSNIPATDPGAMAVKAAIVAGDLVALDAHLEADAELVSARIVDGRGCGRTLLHVATDWPGHFPNVGAVIRRLAERGADVNAAMIGPHAETPLHWAASCDDVEAIDALLDSGSGRRPR